MQAPPGNGLATRLIEVVHMKAFTSILCVTTLHATWLAGYSQDVFVLPLFAAKQFHCLTSDHTYSYTWRVNETVVTSNSTFPDVVYITSQTLSNGSTRGSLTFRAYAQFNNTGIECFVTDHDRLETVPQLNYNIVIQGYLSPPDVTYVMEPHSVRFSWSAPFSLNITDYEPDILYYVVNITADDKSRSTMNTTDTVYLLQPDLCLFLEYRVDIAAVNIVGIGEKYTSPPLSLEALSLGGSNVIFGKAFPVINIQISKTCLDDIHYNVELIPTFSTKKVVISNSSSVGQSLLTLSSSDIQLNEYYEAVERSTFLHHLEISTFDVQTVEITPQNDVKEFTDITCHFALGSLVKGCRIVISTTDGDLVEGINDHCEYTATREEGSTEGTISVMLPRGEYTVVVYDDEDAEVENPAYNTTIAISSSSVMEPSVSEATMKTISSITEETGQSNDTVIIAVVVPVAVVVILLLISVMAVLIYKYLNGTKSCSSKPPNAIEQDKNSTVVYASIPDLTQTSATSSLSPSSRDVFEGQNTPGIGLVNNPAYSLCLPKSQLSAIPSTPSELEYNMQNNPLYMRNEMPYGTSTSPVHNYDYVTVGNV